MKKILLCTLLTLLCFNTANATWTVKELSDNQITAYVRGEVNLYNRVIFFFRKENCSKPAHYFVLNTKSSKEELIKGQIRQLLFTVPGERVMLPSFGLHIRQYLFSPIDSIIIENIKKEISNI